MCNFIERERVEMSIKKIFVKGNNPFEYGYFGWGEYEAQFYMYSEGYKESADILIETAINQSNHTLNDKIVFPAIFSYRQYLELVMKDLYIQYSIETEEKKKKVIDRKSHSLIGIWNSLRPIIDKYASNDDKDEFDEIEQLILEFHNYDIGGDAFRYPVDRKLELHHDEWIYLDLVNLKSVMNDLYNRFDIMKSYLQDKREKEIELLIASQ